MVHGIFQRGGGFVRGTRIHIAHIGDLGAWMAREFLRERVSPAVDSHHRHPKPLVRSVNPSGPAGGQHRARHSGGRSLDEFPT